MNDHLESRYRSGGYLADNPTWHDEYGDWKAARIHELWMSTGLAAPRTVAEIGCGSGAILASLQRRLPETVSFSGFDIATEAIARARKYAGPRLDFHCDDLLARNLNFDVLLCIDVFEHVENPFEFLRSIRRIAPLVVFNIPLEIHVAGTLINHQLLTRRKFGHLHYYTAAVAMETLRECGYSVVGKSYVSLLTDMPHSMSDYVFWLPRKLLSWISPEFSARVFGGTSLMLIAKGA